MNTLDYVATMFEQIRDEIKAMHEALAMVQQTMARQIDLQRVENKVDSLLPVIRDDGKQLKITNVA